MKSTIDFNTAANDHDLTDPKLNLDETELFEALIRAARLGIGFYDEDDN